jgi:hypothetical protein
MVPLLGHDPPPLLGDDSLLPALGHCGVAREKQAMQVPRDALRGVPAVDPGVVTLTGRAVEPIGRLLGEEAKGP